MSAEVMQKIREQEAHAEEMKQDARAKFKRRLMQANEEGQQMLERSVAEAKKQAGQEKAAAAETAQQEYETILKEAGEKDREISRQGQANMDKAVALIVGRIVGDT